jgi:hypothetical protein
MDGKRSNLERSPQAHGRRATRISGRDAGALAAAGAHRKTRPAQATGKSAETAAEASRKRPTQNS